jgi:regulator of cell morphogenesis and NO signaling
MHPDVTPDALVSTIASAHPATVAVFQRHAMNFCCGGRVSIADACRTHGVDQHALLAELHASLSVPADDQDWRAASLAALTSHIQARYHEPLRAELPRIGDLLARVLRRHGETYPAMLLPLAERFHELTPELLQHLRKEEVVLFPAIVALEAAATARDGRNYGKWAWIRQPIGSLQAEHASMDAKLRSMRAATNGYTLPANACPTFRGLFHDLQELEREVDAHVALENDVLFLRAAELARLQF